MPRLRLLAMTVAAALLLTPTPAHAAAAATGTGVIEGTLTTAKGAPVAGIFVDLRTPAAESYELPLVFTDEAGHFTATGLPAGKYRVGFVFQETDTEQWVSQVFTEAEATWFTVRDGETTVVDESLLPTGGLSITMVNDEPVLDYCVDVVNRHFLKTLCTTTGTVEALDLPVGFYLLEGMPTSGGRLMLADATVVADTVTAVEISLVS